MPAHMTTIEAVLPAQHHQLPHSGIGQDRVAGEGTSIARATGATGKADARSCSHAAVAGAEQHTRDERERQHSAERYRQRGVGLRDDRGNRRADQEEQATPRRVAPTK